MNNKQPLQNYHCKNCGNTFTGFYCNKCGEKVYTNNDKKIGHLFEEVFHFITHFEGSFFTTVKTVFTKPGKLSLDYCNGIRKKYFKPVSLFLLFVVLYLLFPRFQGLNMKLNTYASDQYRFTWISVPLIQSKIKNNQVDYNQVALQYDKKSFGVSKVALFLLIPLGAILLMLLFFNTKKYFFDHSIISLELSIFYIGFHFLIIPFFSFIAEKINPAWISFFYDDNYWLSSFITLIDLLFISSALKTFYQQKWGWIVLKALLYILFFSLIVIYIYRLVVLFFTLLIS